jgi:hypothetical protein
MHNDQFDIEDQDFSENVAVEKLDSWFIAVHVHDKVISVSCGGKEYF